MAFTIVISNALPFVEKDQVHAVFEKLNLGVIRDIDMVNAHNTDRKKFYVHFDSLDEPLRTKLLENEARQQSKEKITPVKITYSVRRDGTECYWNIYAGKTKEQRTADRIARTFAPRIDM